MGKKINIEYLIKRFKEKHNDAYDYLMVEYLKMDSKVKIICKQHGIFEQTPSNHLQGKGCIKCGLIKSSDKNRMKIEDFITNSNYIHNFFYDYENSNYINWKTNINILCPLHGYFNILPIRHLKGYGCKKCKKEKKLINNPPEDKGKIKEDKLNIKKEKFIKKSSEIHDGFYSYKNVNFKNIKSDVIITCPTHGDFIQKPFHHLRGSGCQICSLYKRSRIDFSLYIYRCDKKFNNRFKYSNYTGMSGYVDVECPVHGINKHLSSNHLKSKYGCKFCSYESISKLTSGRIKGSLKYSKEDFINSLSIIHDKKYDYSLLDYTGIRNKIIVICKKHGIFKIQASSHLSGCGCSKCAIETKTKTVQDFIIESNIIHNNKYNYSKVIYIKSSEKIDIICPDHGLFKQAPDTHTRGSGCPKCFKFSRGEEIIKNFLLNNNIIFETEKAFDDCKNINKLRFDFYIPSKNTCIEFDGRQHFAPTKMYGGENGFIKQILRDNIKNEYCINKKIDLIRFSYKDLKKINKILYDKLTT